LGWLDSEKLCRVARVKVDVDNPQNMGVDAQEDNESFIPQFRNTAAPKEGFSVDTRPDHGGSGYMPELYARGMLHDEMCASEEELEARGWGVPRNPEFPGDDWTGA
jgi:hypothetical protein